MLHAILLNKAGRNISSEEVHWRQIFRASEDSLTSTIFGDLLHLPVELFWEILNNSCYNQKITTQPSRILSVEFWPHWKLDDSGKKNFREPDVFIRTTDFDLIIEAKRFDYNGQIREQWVEECKSYLNEYGDDEVQKRIILLAIGGIVDEFPAPIQLEYRNIPVVTCRWTKILDTVKKVRSKLQHSQGYLNSMDSVLRILNDVVTGFSIHGYQTGKWFEEEDFKSLTPVQVYERLPPFKVS